MINEILLITFLDPQSFQPWTDSPALLPALKCTAVGYLSHEDENLVVLSQVLSEIGTACNYVIPKGCILDRSILKIT